MLLLVDLLPSILMPVIEKHILMRYFLMCSTSFLLKVLQKK